MGRRLRLAALAAALLFIGLHLLLVNGLFETRLRAVVLPGLRSLLGPEASIGPVHASLFPPSLNVRDIRIPSDDPRSPLPSVVIERVRLLPWATIFSGVRVVVVASPPSLPVPLEWTAPTWANRYRIERGSLLFLDPGSGLQLELADLTLTASTVRTRGGGPRPMMTLAFNATGLTIATSRGVENYRHLEGRGRFTPGPLWNGLFDVRVEGAELHLTVSATGDDPPRHLFTMAATARVEQFRPFLPWSRTATGEISFTLNGTREAGEITGEGTARLHDLRMGTVELVSEATARLAYQRGRLVLSPVSVTTPASHLAGTISIQAHERTPLLVTGELELSRGPLTGRVTFVKLMSGRLHHPDVTGHVLLSALAWNATPLRSLPLDFQYHDGELSLLFARGPLADQPLEQGQVLMRMDPDGFAVSSLKIEAFGGTIVGAGRVGLDGSVEAELSLQALIVSLARLKGTFSAHASVTGSLQPASTITVVLKSDGLQTDAGTIGGGQWTIRLSRETVALEAHTAHGSLTGTILQGGDRAMHADLSFEDAQLDPLLRVVAPLPEDIRVTGTGRLSLSGSLAPPEIQELSIALTALRLTINEASLESEGTISASLKDKTLTFSDITLVGASTRLTFGGRIRVPETVDLTVKGRAEANLIGQLLQGSGQGEVIGALHIVGPWSDPEIQGRVGLASGQLTAPRWTGGLTFSRAAIVFHGHTVTIEALEGQLGPGRFHGSGELTLARLRPVALALTLDLSEVETRLPGLVFYLDGVLTVNADQTGGQVVGDLTIRRGQIDRSFRWSPQAAPLLANVPQVIRRAQLDVHLAGSRDLTSVRQILNIPALIEVPLTVALEANLYLRGTVAKPVLLGTIAGKDGTLYYAR